MIVLKDVCKSYKSGTKAIRGINLTIEDGEFVFIVGSSGSGKSTLIKLLMKELEPDSGSITVDGVNINKMKKRYRPNYRRRIGVVFQDFRLLKDRNAYDNIAFAQRGISASGKEIRRRVPEMLNMVGLSAKYKSYPRQLSGGEQQRVAIARALVNKPEYLFADEPTGNLDPENSREIMRILDQVNQNGTTVVVVTHNREIVDEMQKRVLTMQRGVIVSDDKGGYVQ